MCCATEMKAYELLVNSFHPYLPYFKQVFFQAISSLILVSFMICSSLSSKFFTKTKIQEQGSADNTVTWTTKGAKARVTLNPSVNTKAVIYSHKNLNQLQIHLNNISNRHMKTIAKWFRVHGGRKSVKPEYANEVTKVGQILAEL